LHVLGFLHDRFFTLRAPHLSPPTKLQPTLDLPAPAQRTLCTALY
jgi:hypothetical protein